LGGAARDPHHLVNSGMIVQIVVEAVPPAIPPAVALKDVLEDSSGVKGTRQADGPLENEEWPARMVRCHAIIVEAVSRNFPRTKHGVELHPGPGAASRSASRSFSSDLQQRTWRASLDGLRGNLARAASVPCPCH